MWAQETSKMEDAWESQMMMGVGMSDLRGMGGLQQPSCSRQEMPQEMNMTSPEQEMHHHQEVMAQTAEYFGNQVGDEKQERGNGGDATSGKRRDEKRALEIGNETNE